MEKNIKIGDKEYLLKASPLSLLKYQEQFDEDLLEKLNNIKDMTSTKGALEVLKMAYAMSKNEGTFEEFLENNEGAFVGFNFMWVREVISLVLTIFQRSGQKQEPEQK